MGINFNFKKIGASIGKGVLTMMYPAIGAAIESVPIAGPLFGRVATKDLGDFLKSKGLLPADAPAIEPTEDAVMAVIDAAAEKDPTILLELKKFDADFQLKMAELDFKFEDLAQRDRDSARRLQEITKDKTPQHLLWVLSLVVVSMFITLLLVKDLQMGIREVLIMIVGQVVQKWASTVDFHVGSSASSARKTEAAIAQGKVV